MDKQNFIAEGLDKKHVSPRDVIPDSGKKENKKASAKVKKKYPYPGDPNKKQGFTNEELPVITRHHKKVAAAENARKNKEHDKVSSSRE